MKEDQKSFFLKKIYLQFPIATRFLAILKLTELESGIERQALKLREQVSLKTSTPWHLTEPVNQIKIRIWTWTV